VELRAPPGIAAHPAQGALGVAQRPFYHRESPLGGSSSLASTLPGTVITASQQRSKHNVFYKAHATKGSAPSYLKLRVSDFYLSV